MYHCMQLQCWYTIMTMVRMQDYQPYSNMWHRRLTGRAHAWHMRPRDTTTHSHWPRHAPSRAVSMSTERHSHRVCAVQAGELLAAGNWEAGNSGGYQEKYL